MDDPRALHGHDIAGLNQQYFTRSDLLVARSRNEPTISWHILTASFCNDFFQFVSLRHKWPRPNNF